MSKGLARTALLAAFMACGVVGCADEPTVTAGGDVACTDFLAASSDERSKVIKDFLADSEQQSPASTGTSPTVNSVLKFCYTVGNREGSKIRDSIAFESVLLPDVLDEAAVEQGVSGILTDTYGIQGVSNVDCPANVRVESGRTFTCSAVISAKQRSVPVKITDSEGTYEVGRPD
ncbi:DUF4333 domain-containing protein [Nocardia ignorata]|uniref:DUF4333 domain-containing protein n=1 Tax=Nocardia ignorata TaxID=145285 RepID=UPI000A05E1CF|nr:DUF4333 domain-containing protein [Nocardia ignorata]